MSRRKILANFILLSLFTVIIGGCGKAGDTEANINIFTKDSGNRSTMLDEPSVDYELPGVYPSIAVDLLGYEVGRDKEAVLSASRLPAFYEIKDAATGKVVYQGSVKKKDIESKDGLSSGVIDFSGLNTVGTYYIETEILGRSKVFKVRENLYEDLYKASFIKLHDLRCENCHMSSVALESDASKTINAGGGWHTSDKGEKDVVEGCLAVMDICTIYEFYPKLFTDDYGIEESGNRVPDILDEAAYEIEWLLLMQNKETGGVYASVSYAAGAQAQSGDNLAVRSETTRSTAYFCACMAKASFTFKRFDADLSSKAMQASVLAWKCLEANKNIVDSGQMFRAATELYRLTGQETYKSVVTDFLKVNSSKPYDSRPVLDGAITYLSTARSTDVGYCTALMDNLMKREESKVALANGSSFEIESVDADISEIIRTAYEYAIVDYINSSIEYVNGEEDCFHYVGGRNATGTNYFDSINTPNSLVNIIAVGARLASSADK
ncbi:MAG: glycoside hydrolase family 9 protein [Lachnospiraceae bacterium]|nr:glycoside hydrolase family 9 protein [Lachnospiraceae bacterium]